MADSSSYPDRGGLAERVGAALLHGDRVPVSVKDPSGHYQYANRGFLAAIGRDHLDPDAADATLFPPPQAERQAAHDRACLESGLPRIDEERLLLAGTERTFLVHRLPFLDAGGPALASFYFEVTPRNRAEHDLLASRALFMGILDIAADAVVSIDQSQRIVLFNQGAERIFGYTAAEVLGRPLEILLPEEARKVHSRHLGQFARAPDAARQMGERGTIFGRRKDGSIFPAEASISRVNIDGRLTFTAILRDVTANRAVEAAMARLNEDLVHRATQLENANRELEAFSYSVSHDLRQPLRAIDGFSQVLIEDYAHALDDEGQDALERIRSASQRMSQLIDDILNLSRLTRGTLERSPVDLSSMARSVADELAGSQPDRQVDFVIAPDLTDQADPHLTRVVLSNLLGNAWKYTGKHPRARIEFGALDRGDGQRVYYVKDDGVGFDMTYSDKLFGAFQRLHGAEEYPGTGVGLATVQRIIHKHGGEVWAEGAPDLGATISFTLH